MKDAVKKYRTTLKTLGFSDKTIEQNLTNAVESEINSRVLQAKRSLFQSLETMTIDELMELRKGGAQ